MPPHQKKKITPSPKQFIPIPMDILKQELKVSYEKKRNEMITFFTKVKENTSQEKTTPEEEEMHIQIIYQNLRKMIQEGEKLLMLKREATPFRTLILHFDDEKDFVKIQRNHRMCADGVIRDSAYEYVEYLLQKDVLTLHSILENESSIFTFTYQQRENKMLQNQIQQIQNEYPEFYNSMFFFHHRTFTPIQLFTFFATLKL
jgi:hypothetical protein